MSRKTMIELIVTAALITAATTVAYAAETVTYSYDAKGRLILVSHAGTINNNIVANYTLDPADNRKNLKVTGAP